MKKKKSVKKASASRAVKAKSVSHAHHAEHHVHHVHHRAWHKKEVHPWLAWAIIIALALFSVYLLQPGWFTGGRMMGY